MDTDFLGVWLLDVGLTRDYCPGKGLLLKPQLLIMLIIKLGSQVRLNQMLMSGWTFFKNLMVYHYGECIGWLGMIFR